MKANKKGVSLLWALVSLIVILLVVTGMLMMAQVYHKREVTSIEKTRSDYYARSGINIASAQIKSGDLPVPQNAGDTKKYVIVIDNGTESDTSDDIKVNVTLRKKTAYQIEMESEYTIQTTTSVVYGRMLKEAGVWSFQGFYTK